MNSSPLPAFPRSFSVEKPGIRDGMRDARPTSPGFAADPAAPNDGLSPSAPLHVGQYYIIHGSRAKSFPPSLRQAAEVGRLGDSLQVGMR
ncbi:unnamed protein product [Ectocarpus sp. 6 AP-2014]